MCMLHIYREYTPEGLRSGLLIDYIVADKIRPRPSERLCDDVKLENCVVRRVGAGVQLVYCLQVYGQKA